MSSKAEGGDGRSPRSGAPAPKKHGWPKGVSGNPGGRCKAGAAIAKLIAQRTENGAELVTLALDVVRGVHEFGADPTSWRYCHNWLTERVAGKAPMTVELRDETTPLPDYSAMTEGAIRALAELEANCPVVPEAEAETEDVGPGEPGPIH